MGSFSVSVEVALSAFAAMVASHLVGVLGASLDKSWICFLAAVSLLACLLVMPLVWALPALFMVVFWRPPSHAYAMWTLGFYFQGFVLTLWLFIALPPTIDPKSDGERSARSTVYFERPLDTVVTTATSLVAFCVTFGTVAAIHKYQEYWTADIGRNISAVICLSGLQRFVGACVAGFKHPEDPILAFVLVIASCCFYVASARVQRFDQRQLALQGPGVFAAGLTGLMISFTMDGVLQELEVYQLVFTALAWISCGVLAFGYLKRYQWVNPDANNLIQTMFSHWLVKF